MKKFLLFISAAIIAVGCFAFQKALYVKKGDSFSKFNFGVAGDLHFFNNGHSLKVTGYDEVINLDEIDYITFSAPIDESALKPDAQKERLISIGKDINNAFSINDEADMVRLFYEFLNEYEDTDTWDYYKVMYYRWPEGFGRGTVVNDMVNAAYKTIRGNASQVMGLASGALEVHRMSDFRGVYTANNETGSWDKTADADYFEARYRGKFSDRTGNFAIRVSWSGNESTWTVKDQSISTPEKMTVTFFENDRTLATFNLTTSMVQNQKINLAFDFAAKITKAEGTINMLPDGIDFDVTESFRGAKFATQKGRIDGADLLDFEKLQEHYDQAKEVETWNEEENRYDYIEGDAKPLMSHFIRAHADTDVLGKLQAKGRLYDFTDFYESSRGDESDDMYEFTLPDGSKYETYAVYVLNVSDDKSVMEYSYEASTASSDKLCDYLNNKSDVQFSYDGNGRTQGFLAWDVDIISDDYARQDEWRYQQGYYIQNNRAMSVYKEYDYNTGTEKYFVYTDDGQVEIPASQLVFPEVETEKYYEVSPKLVFSDLTSFYIGDFFTKEAFGSNVDDYNALIDAYFTITGHNSSSEDVY